MAEKSIVQKFLERVTSRKCEEGHELPPGKNFCPDCGKPQQVVVLTEEQRLTEMEAVLAELLKVTATPDKSDDNAFWANVRKAGKKLITPTVESTPKKSK